MTESQNLRISEFPNKFVSRYKDLVVYQKAFEVSLEIHKLTLEFPKIEQYGGLADQMRRASKSITANIAEGYAKQQRSKVEFKRFLLIALGSAEEMSVWIEYAIALGYIDQQTAKDWVKVYGEIIRMLQTLYSKIKT
jgi:four helix bundle protein